MILPKTYDSYRLALQSKAISGYGVVDHSDRMKPYLQFLFSKHATGVMPAYLLDYSENSYIDINPALLEMLNVSKRKILDNGLDGARYHFKSDDYDVYNEQLFFENLRYLSSIDPHNHINHTLVCNYRVSYRNSFVMVRQQSYIIRSTKTGLPLMVLGYILNIDKLNHQNQIFHQMFNGDRTAVIDNIYTPDERHSIFSKRERAIIKLVVNGISTEKISQQLYLSKNTVYTYRKRILLKAGTNDWKEIERML